MKTSSQLLLVPFIYIPNPKTDPMHRETPCACPPVALLAMRLPRDVCGVGREQPVGHLLDFHLDDSESATSIMMGAVREIYRAICASAAY